MEGVPNRKKVSREVARLKMMPRANVGWTRCHACHGWFRGVNPTRSVMWDGYRLRGEWVSSKHWAFSSCADHTRVLQVTYRDRVPETPEREGSVELLPVPPPPAGLKLEPQDRWPMEEDYGTYVQCAQEIEY